MNKNKLLMLFFVGSEAFFFLALIIAYVDYSRPGGTLSSTSQYLNITATSIFTIFLLASSLTIWLAEINLKKGKRSSLLIWLSATILFGMIFLFGQGNEYYDLIAHNVTISQNVFGSAFFTLTGFHGLHVIIGLIVLIIMAVIFSSRKFENLEKSAFQSVAIYWHFVDIIWIVVFSVVYIGAII